MELLETLLPAEVDDMRSAVQESLRMISEPFSWCREELPEPLPLAEVEEMQAAGQYICRYRRESIIEALLNTSTTPTMPLLQGETAGDVAAGRRWRRCG